MLRQLLICIALVPTLAGCSGSNPITRISFVAGLGAGVYLYKDNWTLEETQVGDDKFRITLKKNMLRQGGDSEGDMLFKRRAGEIVAELGYDGYRIMEYDEGIESAALGSQRVAHGLIRCYKGATNAK